MAVALASATQTALNAGRIVDRGMILLDLGSGLYGFWSGHGPFVYGGITYVGAGSLISVEGIRQTTDLSAVQVVGRLTAIENTALTPDVLASIENEAYHQRPCVIMTAYFDPDTYALLSVEPKYRGYIDRVVHSESADGAAVLEFHLESRFRDHQRTGYRMRSDLDQRRLSATDGGLRHVATVATQPILFGRSEASSPTPQPPPKKKGFFERLFG